MTNENESLTQPAQANLPKVKALKLPFDRAVLISDIHLGVRNASEQWLDNIEKYFYEWFIPQVITPLSQDNTQKTCVLCLGDIFDDRKNINIGVNDAAISIFESISKVMPVYIINGNHDLYKKTNTGATSLRSLYNIPGVTVITEPTVLVVDDEVSHIAVPYLGDVSIENAIVNSFSGKCRSAFLHTDIAKMSYDNGRSIMSGVSPDAFRGHIWSGHIHKRQENRNVTYIGSPYQLDRSDLGNQKGLYIVDLYTGQKLGFVENNYSPQFLQISIEQYEGLTEEQKRLLLDRNYVDILIPESSLGKYDLNQIYEFSATTETKKVSMMVNHTETKKELAPGAETEEELSETEKDVEELIELSIDELDVSDEDKAELKKMSESYMKAARQEHPDSII